MYKTSALLAGTIFLSGAAFAAMTPYRAVAGVEILGLSNAGFGLIMGLSAVVSAFTAVALGWLSDRVTDRRVILLLCAAMGILAFGLVWVFQTPLVFAAAFVFLVPFGSALFSQSFSFSRTFFDRERPDKSQFIMSFLRAGFTLAWIIVPPFAGWLAANGSAFSTFGFAALAHLGCTITVGLLWTQSSAAMGAAPIAAQNGGPIDRPKVSNSHKLGIAGIALALSALQLNMVSLPMLIVRELSGSMAQVGIAASLAAAIEVPAMILWGYLALRMDKELILAIAAGFFALYFGFAFTAETFSQILIAQGFAAIAISALLSINIAYLQEAIPGRIGLSTSLVDVTRVLSVWIAAAVFSMNPGTTYAPLMAVAGGLCLVAIVLLLAALGLRRAV